MSYEKFAENMDRMVDELHALNKDPTMTQEKWEKLQLARLSADRLRGFLAQIEAGNVVGDGDGADVAEEDDGDDTKLTEVFSVRALLEEAERRGWPPLRKGPA